MDRVFTIALAGVFFGLASCADSGSNPPPPPVISSVQPDSAASGDVIRIQGSGFGAARGQSSVRIGGASVSTFSTWSPTEIRAVVPVGATSGTIIVTVDGIPSNDIPFTLTSSGGSGGISFSNDVLPILNTGCALGGCHRPPSPSSGFDQSTFSGVRAGGSKFGTAVVVPGDSSSSRIIQAMRGTAPGLGRMPFGGPWVTSGVPDSLIGTIALWIQEGALNN